MTNRATLEALLARVMEGEGWDAKLNADIAVTLGGWQRKWHDSERPHGWYWRRGDYSWTAEGEGYPSNYLGSLDAALTLVPEGWRYDLSSGDLLEKPAARLTPDCASPHFEGYAQTVPRALIAACLKARMEALGE